MDFRIIAIIVIFAVLIVFVVLGQRRQQKQEPLPKEPLNSKEQAARGRVEKAYLVAAGPRDLATFRATYRSGDTCLETVQVQSERYDAMRAAEPERLHLDGSWGNDITIVYQDGTRVVCKCAWTSWEASQLRDALLQQNRRA